MLPNLTAEIVKYAKQYEADLIHTHRHLHIHPELSSHEFETVKFLKKEITNLAVKIEDVPDSTGFTAMIDTGKPGKTVAIRTDIDALPIMENPENQQGKRKYISKNEGVMHACGHDAHMAIVLTVMRIIDHLKAHLTGKIYFLFEEGEEIGAGIDAMLAHLKNKKIDAIYGNHVAAFLDSGKISVDPGPKMAGAILVNFTVRGQGGHGSRPDHAVNPVFAAANILTGITSAWANQVDVSKTVTLGITEIHGGSAMNVIPDTVKIRGSLRFFDVKEGLRAIDILKNVITHTAAAHLCKVDFSDEFELKVKPVINDEKLAIIAEKGVEEVLPESIEKNVPWFASEPFSRYREIAPSVFSFIGIRNKAYGSGAEHHNEKFDVDENALINGVLATTKFAVDYLLDEER